MGVNVHWKERPSGVDIHTGKPFGGFQRASGEDTLVIDTNYFQAHGVFKASDITAQTTTTAATPDDDGSLLITDIVITAKRVQNATADIQFSDGTNTVLILAPDMSNAPVNLPWQPVGRIQGWRDADLRVVTAGANPDMSILFGYVKIPNGLLFKEWDALR